MRRLPVLVLCAFLATVAFTATANAAPPDPHHPPGLIYDSTVRPLPGNLPSVGAEAYAFTELGDQVTFAGTDRLLKSVTVTLSSWGCQNGHWYSADCITAHHATFSQPITFNIYTPATNGSGVPVAGPLLASVTQTFSIPYRPSTDPNHCTGGRWFDGKQGCFNGLVTNVTFDFSAKHVTLPNTVVFGVAYNTSDYGPHPIGQSAPCFTSSGGCPYDSLNIALAPQVNVGSKPFPDTLFQNSSIGGEYCDGGADGTDIMRLDSRTSACWTGQVPAVAFEARKTPPPGRGLKLDEDAISAQQCHADDAHQIVDVNYTQKNDYDSGFAGNAWANDTIKRHLQIWQEGNGTFCARVDDDGSFVTFAGPSPSGTSTVSADVHGEIHGGYVTTFFTGTLDPNPAYRTHGDLGSFDLMCDPSFNCPGAHPSYLSYFSTTSGDDLAHWGWIYHAGSHGTWLNQDDVSPAEGGDIVG